MQSILQLRSVWQQAARVALFNQRLEAARVALFNERREAAQITLHVTLLPDKEFVLQATNAQGLGTRLERCGLRDYIHVWIQYHSALRVQCAHLLLMTSPHGVG